MNTYNRELFTLGCVVKYPTSGLATFIKKDTNRIMKTLERSTVRRWLRDGEIEIKEHRDTDIIYRLSEQI